MQNIIYDIGSFTIKYDRATNVITKLDDTSESLHKCESLRRNLVASFTNYACYRLQELGCKSGSYLIDLVAPGEGITYNLICKDSNTLESYEMNYSLTLKMYCTYFYYQSGWKKQGQGYVPVRYCGNPSVVMPRSLGALEISFTNKDDENPDGIIDVSISIDKNKELQQKFEKTCEQTSNTIGKMNMAGTATLGNPWQNISMTDSDNDGIYESASAEYNFTHIRVDGSKVDVQITFGYSNETWYENTKEINRYNSDGSPLTPGENPTETNTPSLPPGMGGGTPLPSKPDGAGGGSENNMTVKVDWGTPPDIKVDSSNMPSNLPIDSSGIPTELRVVNDSTNGVPSNIQVQSNIPTEIPVNATGIPQEIGVNASNIPSEIEVKNSTVSGVPNQIDVVQGSAIEVTGRVTAEGTVTATGELIASGEVVNKYEADVKEALIRQGNYAFEEGNRRVVSHNFEYAEDGARIKEKEVAVNKNDIEYSKEVKETYKDAEGKEITIYQGYKNNADEKTKREVEARYQQKSLNQADILDAGDDELGDNRIDVKEEIESRGIEPVVAPEELNDYEIHANTYDAYTSPVSQEKVDVGIIKTTSQA